MNNAFLQIPGINPDELAFLNSFTSDLSPEEKNTFLGLYISRRQKTDNILIFTLLGLVLVAGIQRFVLNQIGMGLLYFLTGGLCLIGTILDIVNHKSLTLEYNQKMAVEALNLVKMQSGIRKQDSLFYNP